MKKKETTDCLFRCPRPSKAVRWSSDGEGLVTLEVDNTGWANRLAQLLFRRPAVSYIHLDTMGSFVWPLLDGETTVSALGERVEARFGEGAQPLYQRLIQYFRILHSYRLISWV